MLNLFILLLASTVCYGTFFTPAKPEDAMNVCVYSKDPGQFMPKCFPCLSTVYPSALQTCVNGTTMPSNITYASATCLEKNCAINYPTRAPPPTVSYDSAAIKSLASFFGFNLRPARSIDDNKIHDSSSQSSGVTVDSSGFRIIGQVETFASESDFTELEFSESIKQFE